jgi:hypothetical protein
MRHAFGLIVLMAGALAVPAHWARAQSNTPWLTPTYRSPPNLSEQHAMPPPPEPHAPVQSPPPPIVSPHGQPLPNLPTLAPSGPHGRESFQDRAARCAHQADLYGLSRGDRSTYIGNCVNQ